MSTEKLDLAIALAKYAHKGQVDKAGMPYINHPLAVADMVDGENNKIVAVLHDVLEDTNVKASTIQNLFGNEVSYPLIVLTHNNEESYDDYINRVANNETARIVKLADLQHNMDLSRLPTVTEKDLKRKRKYEKAYQYLKSLPE